MRRCDLTDTHAQRDGFTSVAEMHEALDTHYPGLGMDDPVDVVTFDSFSAFRQRVTATIDEHGVSPSKTSNGRPHMVLNG